MRKLEDVFRVQYEDFGHFALLTQQKIRFFSFCAVFYVFAVVIVVFPFN